MAAEKKQPELLAQNFFSYNANFSSVAAGASPIQTLTIQSDSDFEIQKLSYGLIYDLTAAPDPLTLLAIPAVNVLITDAGTSQPWMDQPVPVYSLFGSGQLPFIMSNPKIINRKQQLTIQVFNQFTGTNIDLIALSFIGRRLYDNA